MKQFDLEDYLFGNGAETMSPQAKLEVEKKLRNEMKEIFYGMNMDDE